MVPSWLQAIQKQFLGIKRNYLTANLLYESLLMEVKQKYGNLTQAKMVSIVGILMGVKDFLFSKSIVAM